MTNGNGNTALGIVFQVSPTGNEAVLHNFTDYYFLKGLTEASDGTFYGTVLRPIGGGPGEVFQINLNGGPGTLAFSTPTASVDENSVSVSVNVTRTGDSVGAVGIHYSTANGTATVGVDYTAISGTLSWANGDVSPKTITVPILDAGSPGAVARASAARQPKRSTSSTTMRDRRPARRRVRAQVRPRVRRRLWPHRRPRRAPSNQPSP